MSRLPFHVCAISSAVIVAACSAPSPTPSMSEPPPSRKASLTRATFATMQTGEVVEAFTLINARGIEVRVITYGGIITSLRTPDRQGQFGDIVLGHDSIDGYLARSPYIGAIVGRYGNRIARGQFVIDGTTYSLATNNGPNHLHGGVRGFDKVHWRGEPFEREDAVGVVLRYTSPDGEEGYPGTLEAQVTYTLRNDDTFTVEYAATSNKPTHVNLTQHSYFNLVGDGTRDVLDHELQIRADRFTPVDATLIPTGEVAPVQDTPFDFREPTPIGARIEVDDPQIRNGLGYDHNFVLNREGDGLVEAIRVREPATGRTMTVSTTEPGVQFYSGNFLDGSITGKGGHVYRRRFGFCLETQHFPDSPNKPHFPSTLLRPGSTYRSTTVYKFGVDR